MRYLVLIVLLFVTFTSLKAQTVAQNRCNNFGKGMNVSNWLEAYWQTGWPTTSGYTFNHLKSMKDAGITSLRLPICFAQVTDTLYPYAVDVNHPLFTRVDSVIAWANILQMNVIIDNHHGWDIFNSNWRIKLPRFCSLWSALAQRYAYLDPERFTFELLNEPAYGIDIDSLNVVFAAAIDTIRKYDVTHSIIVSPNFSSSGQAFAGYQPFADTNLIYTWHSYDPYQFTHQGFSWGTPYVPAGTPFPSPFDNMLHNAWQQVTAWKSQHNRPVFLGEFGTGELADPVSRCNWISYFGARIDSFNMPWFYWDWQWDFTLFNRHQTTADSVIPCFKSALHLYGDTLSSVVSFDDAVELSVYPNPSNNACFIQLPDAFSGTLTVCDLKGQWILEKNFEITSQWSLETANLPEGLYVVRISTGKYNARKLLLVLH